MGTFEGETKSARLRPSSKQASMVCESPYRQRTDGQDFRLAHIYEKCNTEMAEVRDLIISFSLSLSLSLSLLPLHLSTAAGPLPLPVAPQSNANVYPTVSP